MKFETGKQYDQDDPFKKAARKHQSQYRADVLKVGFEEYGNRLRDEDAKGWLNYYEGLDVRKVQSERYPEYSKKRDADMLRSEHIPFNMFVPLAINPELAKQIIRKAFCIHCNEVLKIKFEYAPEPIENYLNDGTAFDVFIHYLNEQNVESRLGIEVKYTEKAYEIGETEKKNVVNKESKYWKVTKESRAFADAADPVLGTDEMRQIWRNHLLGLAMVLRNEIKDFTSIILYPEGNRHFRETIPKYQALLSDSHKEQVRGCTYETFIAAISGNEEIDRWKEYLKDRYLVKT